MDKPKSNRKFDKKPFAIFEETQRRLGLAEASKLCVQLGYKTNTWFQWKATGEMPLPAAKLCELLVKQHEKLVKEPTPLAIYLLRPETKEQIATLEALCAGMQIRLAKLAG